MRPLSSALVAVLVSVSSSLAATGDPAVDALIEKLVQKKVITTDDARELEKDLGKPVREPTPAPTEPARASSEPAPREGAQGKKQESKLKLPVEIKIRGQFRYDVGDLLVGPDGKYETESDLYLRRVRLEVEKEFKSPPLGKQLDLNLTLDADRFDQEFRNGRRRDPSNDLNLHYIYGDWIFFDQFGLEVGKHKLPFLRVELTSSSRLLLIDRSVTTGAAKDLFGSYEQIHVMPHGEFAGGAFRYFLSYSDGVASLGTVQDLDSAATSVQRHGWGKAFVGRLELSPFGFADRSLVEKKKDDTGIGGESHLTLGIDGGVQQDIRYATASVADARVDTTMVSVDLAGRYTFGAAGTLTGQLEYVYFKKDFNYKGDVKPQGGYLQAGYLLPWRVLRGRLEPAARYEIYEQDQVQNSSGSGSRERIFSIGFNHYLLKHSVKWAYNFVHTRFDSGISEASGDTTRDLHQLQLQLYF